MINPGKKHLHRFAWQMTQMQQLNENPLQKSAFNPSGEAASLLKAISSNQLSRDQA
jgi:hypothetical protein